MRTDLLRELQQLPSTFPGMSQVASTGVYLMGCRSFEQFCGTIRSLTEPKRFCPFCCTERARRNQSAAESTASWMLLQNEYPHKGTESMWLIVPKRHLSSPIELVGDDWMEIGDLLTRCLHTPNMDGGGIMWRFGDPRFHAGTVEHLHINIIRPVPESEYRPPFAKTSAEHGTDYLRMLGFRDELTARGGTSWLFSPEGIAETQPKV